MGYQRSTFLLSEYLFEKKIVPARLRVDKGSETGDMATMHTFLRRGHDDLENPCESYVRKIYSKSDRKMVEVVT